MKWLIEEFLFPESSLWSTESEKLKELCKKHYNRKYFDWQRLFFLELKYFNTFLAFQDLDIFYKIPNEQMIQIEKLRAAARKKHLITSRNRQSSKRQGFLKKWIGSLKVWWKNSKEMTSEPMYLKKGK